MADQSPYLRDWQAYPLTPVPSEVIIPAEGTFILPVCTDARRLSLMLKALTEWKEFEHYPESGVFDHMIDVLEALAFINQENPCGAGTFPDCDEHCQDYAANSHILTYAPNDPYQTPQLTPPGYNAPPWRTFAADNIPFQLTGVQAGDALVSRWAFEPNEWWQFVIPLAYFVDQFLNLPALIDSGFPRVKVHVQGAGTVELHLLAIPYGGDALILVDGEPNSQTRLVNLATYTLGSALDLNEIIEAVMGFVFTDADAVQENIIEVALEGDTAHTIEVIFLPHIDLGGDFGFGGGLRKVVLCNEELEGVANQMPEFQLEDLLLKWRPNPDAAFESLGQVIFPVNMRQESGEIQWTVQPLPIGGGADPFEEWIPLLSPITSAEVDMLPYGSDPTASVENGVLSLGIPNARGITEVFLETLEAGQEPEVEFIGQGLIFRLPPAAGIASVAVEMLAYTEEATAELEDGILSLGLPRGRGIEEVNLLLISHTGASTPGAELVDETLFLKIYKPLENVNVESVAYDAMPTAELEDGLLSLGIPRGRGIVEVALSLTEPDTEPTAELLGESLLLTIPAAPPGAPGHDGRDGLDAEGAITSVSLALTAHGTPPSATLTSGALALSLPAPLDGTNGMDGQDCNCDNEPAQPIPEGDGEHDETYQCGKAIGLVDYIIAILYATQGYFEANQSAGLTYESLTNIPQLNPAKFAALYIALQGYDFEAAIALDIEGARQPLYEAFYCALDDTDTLSDADIAALKALSGLPEDLQTGFEAVFAAFFNRDLRYKAWIFAHIGGDCSEFERCAPEGCEESEYFCGVFEFDLVATSDAHTPIPAPTSPTTLYRLTVTGTYSGGSFLRDFFYYQFSGETWQFGGVLYPMMLGCTSDIDFPAWNAEHEYAVDIQGDGNVWEFVTGDSANFDNTIGDVHIKLEAL